MYRPRSRPPGRRFAITHGEQRARSFAVRIWYRVKTGIFTGAIEFIFVLTIKMEIAGELFGEKGNHLAVVDICKADAPLRLSTVCRLHHHAQKNINQRDPARSEFGIRRQTRF